MIVPTSYLWAGLPARLRALAGRYPDFYFDTCHTNAHTHTHSRGDPNRLSVRVGIPGPSVWQLEW